MQWTITRLLTLFLLLNAASTRSAARLNPPNIVLIVCDDLGYGDIEPFGATNHPTPHLNRMAREGTVFTDFHVGASVGSPSRAALFTGCYPVRAGVPESFAPDTESGLHSNEITIPELIRIRGYATALYGKWHLGHHPKFLPPQQGFDEWFGLPYSHDMWPQHPTRPDRYPELPLMEGETVINAALRPEDQKHLTSLYTDRALAFIRKNRRRPFFICLALGMPHVPLFASTAFEGGTGLGLYADVISEIDSSIGRILDTLRNENLDRGTWVIFTSDNGPWLAYGNHAGSAGPLRGGKDTAFEGGFRVPCIMRWPGQIPAGKSCGELATTLDLLPTIATLLRLALPGDRVIDGRDISPLIFGKPGARTPHEAFYYYSGTALHAVRNGPWKLVLPHTYNHPAPAGQDGQPGRNTPKSIDLSLFNLQQDIGEQQNVADRHPDVVQRLQSLAEQARIDLGDHSRPGKNVRPTGR